MNIVRLSLLFSLLPIAAGAADIGSDYQRVFGANPNSIEPAAQECMTLPPGEERSECLSEHFGESRAQLREAVIAVLDSLSGEAEAAFRRAQALWVQARQHQCDALVIANPMPAGDCFTELNLARVSELQRLLALLTPMDPGAR